MWNDHLSNLKKKACQFSRQSNKLFVDEIPHYIYNLPRVSQHLERWTFNLLYFAIGLLYNWAVHAVLQQMPDMHQFPSNVAGMIVLFFLLMCSHAVFPKFTDNFVRIIDPYSSFALRSMNIMFVPAVVEIVNNPSTSGPEIGRMICVFSMLSNFFISRPLSNKF
jgi:putative effector of murein hydrolase LrgA (UPF0299 family)